MYIHIIGEFGDLLRIRSFVRKENIDRLRDLIFISVYLQVDNSDREQFAVD
jgi:hypothetical protein